MNQRTITQALIDANPLQNEDFIQEIHLAKLAHNEHDELPRKVEHTFLIRDLWNLVGSEETSPAFEARFTRAALPSYHAILAEALHCQQEREHPSFHDLHGCAMHTTRVLLRQRVKEIGAEATYAELRFKFLQAAAQMAESGFTPQALGAIAQVVGLAKLDTQMRYVL